MLSSLHGLRNSEIEPQGASDQGTEQQCGGAGLRGQGSKQGGF